MAITGIASGLNTLGSNLGAGIQQTAQQFGQNTMKGLGYVGQTAQGLAQIPFRVGASLIDVPRTIAGKQPLQPFTVPGLGSISTYARQAVNQTNDPNSVFSGKPILSAINAGSKGILDTATLGLGAQSLLNTPGAPTYNSHQGSGADVFQQGQRNATGGLNMLDQPQHLYHGYVTAGSDQAAIKGMGATNAELGKGFYLADTPEAAKVFGNAQTDVYVPGSVNTYSVKGDLLQDPLYREALKENTLNPDLAGVAGKHGYGAVSAPLDVGGRQTILTPAEYAKETALKGAAGGFALGGGTAISQALSKAKEGITNMLPAYTATVQNPKAKGITPQEMRAQDSSRLMNRAYRNQTTYGAPSLSTHPSSTK